MRTSSIVAILASVSTTTALALPLVDAPAVAAVEERQIATGNDFSSIAANLVNLNTEALQVKVGVSGLENANLPSKTTGLNGILASLGLDKVFTTLLNNVLKPLLTNLGGGGGLQTTFGTLLSQLQVLNSTLNATGQRLSLDQSQQVITQLTSFQATLQQVLGQLNTTKPAFAAISGGTTGSGNVFGFVQSILGGVLGLGDGNIGTALDRVRSFLQQTLQNSNLLTGSNSVLFQRIDPSLIQTLENLSTSLRNVLNSSLRLYAA